MKLINYLRIELSRRCSINIVTQSLGPISYLQHALLKLWWAEIGLVSEVHRLAHGPWLAGRVGL